MGVAGDPPLVLYNCVAMMRSFFGGRLLRLDGEGDPRSSGEDDDRSSRDDHHRSSGAPPAACGGWAGR